ncbi:PTS system mannose/fructose/sorbose family transporter subunit IID [Anaerosacchariphilus sp. NSJ-68]|uniref:PTS system mannose/fructose/sorbose family transporter subunit IID n=2 Tax=Lachnospiraceae TaxID=186803 RepID=A0A923LA07_9FIRM|nr:MULTISPECIES: PTS system mannose/fructose/sorbose family transporter subunit IID [Lachnospiraceae]MBC5658468.1 PTS system mannose/fructose/sorbose family transporter subunit IID [Anaerosacchariphilus hominis]MBC5698322.1 PTS system mannose/fructose/sorbose family transporter subunit IID [Roseburia difficilis]
MAEAKVLTKKDVQKAALTWFVSSHMTYNYQRLQAGAMTSMLGPVFQKLYGDNKEKIIEGCQRQMLYFNTEPRWGAIIPGMVVALEEAYATDPEGGVDGGLITEIKTALMGPLAGIGDTVWAGLMKPIFLSITLAWAMQGMIAGAWAYWLLAFGFDFGITYYMFMRGYKLGADSVDRFLEGGFVKTVTTAIGIVGMFCLGAMIVKYVGISAVLQIEMTTTTLDFGAILNKIVPSFVPLMMTLLAYWMQVKGKKVTTVLLVLFLIGFIGGAIGFLG